MSKNLSPPANRRHNQGTPLSETDFQRSPLSSRAWCLSLSLFDSVSKSQRQTLNSRLLSLSPSPSIKFSPRWNSTPPPLPLRRRRFPFSRLSSLSPQSQPIHSIFCLNSSGRLCQSLPALFLRHSQRVMTPFRRPHTVPDLPPLLSLCPLRLSLVFLVRFPAHHYTLSVMPLCNQHTTSKLSLSSWRLAGVELLLPWRFAAHRRAAPPDRASSTIVRKWLLTQQSRLVGVRKWFEGWFCWAISS